MILLIYNVNPIIKEGFMNKFGRSTEIIKIDENDFIPDSLKDFNLVVTGALEHFSRKNIQSVIEKLGGNYKSTLNAKTDYLLIGGENVGGKYKKAIELGVKVIDERDFLKLISKNYRDDQIL